MTHNQLEAIELYALQTLMRDPKDEWVKDILLLVETVREFAFAAIKNNQLQIDLGAAFWFKQKEEAMSLLHALDSGLAKSAALGRLVTGQLTDHDKKRMGLPQ